MMICSRPWFLHTMISTCLLLGLNFDAAAQNASNGPAEGEVLYNGIRLPAIWPPRGEWRAWDREPMPVPYLLSPPPVIPIDVGRQLFVDDFLVKETTLTRTYYSAQPHPATPVLRPDKPWEVDAKGSGMAATFSGGVWYDPQDKIFKMWYVATADNKNMAVCLATSHDGIRWDKPNLDVKPGTNIVLEGWMDSVVVWLDSNEKDPKKRFKLFYGTSADNKPTTAAALYLALYCSADGIHWGNPVVAPRKVWSDRNTAFFNPFRNVWVASLKLSNWGKIRGRARAYFDFPDATGLLNFKDQYPDKTPRGIVSWFFADKLDLPDPRYPKYLPEIYDVDAAPYESLMIGQFAVMRNRHPKINEICIGFSRDGFHWHRPMRKAFVGILEKDKKLFENNQPAAGGCVVVGDTLYFYCMRTGAQWEYAGTGLCTLRRDGFASMDAGAEPGTLTTRPVTFKGKNLFVNLDAPAGELRVEVLDAEGKVIEPFGKDACIPVTGNHTLQPVKWKTAADLASIAGKPVRFRFHLKSGKLYAFWVSPDESGASHGYVAAGGPGLTGPTDTVGGSGANATIPSPANKQH